MSLSECFLCGLRHSLTLCSSVKLLVTFAMKQLARASSVLQMCPLFYQGKKEIFGYMCMTVHDINLPSSNSNKQIFNIT